MIKHSNKIDKKNQLTFEIPVILRNCFQASLYQLANLSHPHLCKFAKGGQNCERKYYFLYFNRQKSIYRFLREHTASMIPSAFRHVVPLRRPV